MIDKETKEAVPVTAFLKGDQLAKDIAKVNDAARGRFLSVVGMALAVMKNYDPFHSPTHFKLTDLLMKFDKAFGASTDTDKKYAAVSGENALNDVPNSGSDRWTFQFVPCMSCEALVSSDCRRTEQATMPAPPSEGQVSFCVSTAIWTVESL